MTGFQLRGWQKAGNLPRTGILALKKARLRRRISKVSCKPCWLRIIFVHGYASIDKSLEVATFREIVEKLPYIFDKLKNIVAGDPDPSIKSAFRRVASKNILRYVFLFGSRARGGFGRYSDLAVAFEKRPTIALELDLLVVDPAEALGVHEELIDLVDLDTAPLSLVKTVVDEGKILYEDNKPLGYL